MSEVSGVLIFDKPKGITSQTAVNIVRRVFGTKRVGHTGTLDPMATGVLTILVGSAVRASELLSAENKRYDAGIKLGITTDTLDTTGKVISRHDGKLPERKEFFEALCSFRGDILQTPPMYSALKVGGKKLCDMARAGHEIVREARPVSITELEAECTDSNDEYILHIACSKGTYIRTLCDDIGRELGCGGAMSSLRRTASGEFGIDKAVTEDALKACENPEMLLLPTDSVFSSYPEVRLPEFYSRLAHNGNEIYISKLGMCFEIGERVRMYGSDGEFFAVAECTEFDDGPALKNVKMFV